MRHRVSTSSYSRHARGWVAALVLVGLSGSPLASIAHADDLASLEEITLEDLLMIEVTSVSKKAQRLVDTPSAVHVITAEDIRRSVPVEDIERIEVVRGPGATVWGANAMNGVINIITRSTEDTEDSLVSVGTGSEEHAFGTLRHGGRISSHLGYRFSMGYLDRDHSLLSGGHDSARDQAQVLSGQARFDWTPTDRDRVTFISGYYDSDMRATESGYPAAYTSTSIVRSETENWGGNGSFRWTHQYGEEDSIELAGYFDIRKADSVRNSETRRTLDLTFQQNLRLAERSELVWGLGWRQMDDRQISSPAVTFTDSKVREVIYSGFGQFEHALVPDRLTAILGSKVEWNDVTGWELQPSARFLWNANDTNQVWASVSRSVRTPSRAERHIRAVMMVPFPGFPVMVQGNDDLESDVMLAYELGYRVQPVRTFNVDLALFLNDYENLIDPNVALSFDNSAEAKIYGAEAAATWQVTPWLRLSGSWTGTQVKQHGMRRGTAREGKTPHHQLKIHSLANLPGNLELDLGVYHVGRRELSDAMGDFDISSHWRTDVRVGWHPRENFELALGVHDLLDRHHPEFRKDPTQPLQVQELEVQRNVYVQVRWDF